MEEHSNSTIDIGIATLTVVPSPMRIIQQQNTYQSCGPNNLAIQCLWRHKGQGIGQQHKELRHKQLSQCYSWSPFAPGKVEVGVTARCGIGIQLAHIVLRVWWHFLIWFYNKWLLYLVSMTTILQTISQRHAPCHTNAKVWSTCHVSPWGQNLLSLRPPWWTFFDFAWNCTLINVV